MNDRDKNLCQPAPKLIFPCSGAADVGEVADRAAREMTRDGCGKMFCLAGIGGLVEGIVATARDASQILAIDGCPVDCARLCLEKAGIEGFDHLRVTDLGLKKGESPAEPDRIAIVKKASESILSSE